MHIEEHMRFAPIPDWSREYKATLTWSPSAFLLVSLLSYQKRQGYGLWGVLQRKFGVFCNRFWSAITGCDLPINTFIDCGLLLPHPYGMVVHPMCKIGPNCLIFQQVTLGTNGARKSGGMPTLGAHVDVGMHTIIWRSLTIGDNALIETNSVGPTAVLAQAVAIGIPAQIILR